MERYLRRVALPHVGHRGRSTVTVAKQPVRTLDTGGWEDSFMALDRNSTGLPVQRAQTPPVADGATEAHSGTPRGVRWPTFAWIAAFQDATHTGANEHVGPSNLSNILAAPRPVYHSAHDRRSTDSSTYVFTLFIPSTRLPSTPRRPLRRNHNTKATLRSTVQVRSVPSD